MQSKAISQKYDENAVGTQNKATDFALEDWEDGYRRGNEI